MTNTRALLLLPLAACMLALAAFESAVIDALKALGVNADAVAHISPWFAAVLAGGGFVLLLVVLVGYTSNMSREQQWGPYLAALKPLAGEFGRGVRDSGRGIEFTIQRDGQRIDVLMDPRPGGGLLVKSPMPSRQALAWFAASTTPPLPFQNWREVERNLRWQLRAELPAMTPPLLADPALMAPIERFFSRSAGFLVTHTISGIVIEAGLVPPDAIDVQARLCIDIAFRLRRVNG